jgi:4,5:9,10-diseco-3-hydroxy-5,9,17-trioxoandrosta-1(10),2-diene-4-oate hydrolase
MVRRHTEGSARDRLMKGLPVQQRRLEVNGIATVVLEGGQGPPLLLLHGGIECGGVYWAPVISQLAEHHRLVVPDAPGLGESNPADPLDTAAFIDWFAALLRQTCDEQPTLIAHSLLGSLAARFAAQHGDLLRRLVVYGTPGIGPYHLPLGLLATAILFDLRPSDRNMERFDRWAFFDLDQTRQHDPEWFAAFNAYNLARGAVPHVKQTMRYLIKTCTKRVPDSELRRIEVPTALLWGRHDRFVSLRVGEGARSRLGWPLHVIGDAGHVPHIERPNVFLDAFADATREQTRR